MSRKKLFIRILIILISLIVFSAGYVLLRGAFQKKLPSAVTDEGLDNPFIVPEGTDVIAHRLGAGLFPEDTMMAAKGLLEKMEQGLLKAEAIEVDLHLTKDKELILLHDDTLDRTTDSASVFGAENSVPGDYTLTELRQLNFGAGYQDAGGNYPYRDLEGNAVPEDLRILTLRELLDFLETKGEFKYILEIKAGGEEGMEAMDLLASIVKEYGLEDRAIPASFSEELLAYLDEAYPELHRHASLSEVAEFYLDFLLNRKTDYSDYPFEVLDITPRYGPLFYGEGIGQKFGFLNLMSQGFINRAHECGLAVYYWTVNDEKLKQRLTDRGADGIITDYPEPVH